jgi:hypothetical protein
MSIAAYRSRPVWNAVLLAVLACASVAAQTSRHAFVRVTLAKSFGAPVSGRLLLFAAPASGDASAVDINMMEPTSVYVSAREVEHFAPGAAVDIDTDDVAFPAPLSAAPPGSYRIQAVLDVHHNYAYSGRAPGDLASATAVVSIPFGVQPSLILDQTVPEPPDPLAQRPDVQSALMAIDFVSPVLTHFWERDIHMRGWVLLPPGYAAHPHERYPTVYFTHGFGGDLAMLRGRYAPMFFDRMKSGRMPPMIWVLLDESSSTGTHEFADGANNGPWGTALVTELIPRLEGTYRMDARPNGRFLQGHSSGGWATLWLQTRYPKIFGGTWSTSPDPSDFHNFSTIDLYAPSSNFYRAPDGMPIPLLRDHGKPRATMQQMAELEAVLGEYGGQLASFEWVFSPRGPDGRPMRLFDRITGDIDPAVSAYWCSHYDIAHRIDENWKMLAPELQGKIHLWVGTDDTFYLDGAAHRLQDTLQRHAIRSQFTFLPGRSHFNVYADGDDRYALFDQIAAEMYRVARPGLRADSTPFRRNAREN